MTISPEFSTPAIVLAVPVLAALAIDPWFGKRMYQRLEQRRGHDGQALNRFYGRILLAEWACAAVIFAIIALSPGSTPADFGLTIPTSALDSLPNEPSELAGMVVGLLVAGVILALVFRKFSGGLLETWRISLSTFEAMIRRRCVRAASVRRGRGRGAAVRRRPPLPGLVRRGARHRLRYRDDLDVSQDWQPGAPNRDPRGHRSDEPRGHTSLAPGQGCQANRRTRESELDMATDRRASWLKGVLDLLVLAALTDGESYGYEIAKTLDGAGLGQIRGGTLYPVLNRLEEAGLVDAEFRVSERGPGRRYYRLTKAGRDTLEAQGTLWLAFDGSVRDLLAKGGIG
jgi:PadR family transcriptional regulator PadR